MLLRAICSIICDAGRSLLIKYLVRISNLKHKEVESRT